MSSVDNKRIENKNRHRIMYNAHQNVFNELLKHKPFDKGCDSILDVCLNDLVKIRICIDRLNNIKYSNCRLIEKLSTRIKRWGIKSHINNVCSCIEKINFENLKKACIIHNKISRLFNKHLKTIEISKQYYFLNPQMNMINDLKQMFEQHFSFYYGVNNHSECFNKRIINIFYNYCIDISIFSHNDCFDDIIDDKYRYAWHNNIYFGILKNECANVIYINGFNDMTVKEFIHKYINSEEKS
jgi:hypothetical protein